MTVASVPALRGPSTTTANVTNGVATFSNLILDTAGSYTLTATPSGITGVTAAITSDFLHGESGEQRTSSLSRPSRHSSITAGGTISMSVTVEDTYGNTITTGNTGSTDSIRVAPTAGKLQRRDDIGRRGQWGGELQRPSAEHRRELHDHRQRYDHTHVASAVSTCVTVNPGSSQALHAVGSDNDAGGGSGDNLTITAVDSLRQHHHELHGFAQPDLQWWNDYRVVHPERHRHLRQRR